MKIEGGGGEKELGVGRREKEGGRLRRKAEEEGGRGGRED